MDAIAFITRHEGRRLSMYKDSLGVPTIGVGFNLRRPDAGQILAKVGAPTVAQLLAGAQITPATCDALLRQDVQACTDDLEKLFVDWATMPENIRLVLIDLRFNLGPTRLRGFGNTLDSFRRGDYRDAARRLSMSLWAKQVGKRAEENIELVLAEAKVAP